MSLNTHPLMSGFINQPVLLAAEGRDQFVSCMTALAQHPKFGDLCEAAHNDDNFWPDAGDWRASYRPYIVKDGILHIPVKGVLLHDFAWQLGGWATGYDYIWHAFQRGMEDSAVKGIAFIVNSPGGMVAGCFDALDKMVALKATVGKPVRAFAQESAYSAAYAIIMVADPGGINVSRTGGVGSIGVLTSHMDVSGAMDQAGYVITFIHAGKHKVDGNAYEALPDAVKARIQERIDELYGIFVSAVARGRSMDEDAVRATEALTFTATQALSNGLADNVGTLDDALATFVADLSNNDGEETMSQVQDDSAATATADAAAIAAAENTAKAVADARQAERARITGITGCDEAKGRETLANHIASNTDMSVDDAKAMLAAAPVAVTVAVVEEGAEGKTPFNAAMTKGNPEVGATGGDSGEPGADNDDGSDVLALAALVGLKGFQKTA